MIHYIRILKPPTLYRIGGSRGVIKALITITNDLGDEFCPFDVALKADLVSEEGGASIEPHSIPWKSGMRVLWVEMATEHVFLEPSLRVFDTASSTDGHCSDPIALGRMPLIVGCSCKIDDALQGRGCRRSERRFLLQPGDYLRIDEDIGDSIARHIW